jgi:O-acetylhomoserine (thiol)-lyase
MFFNNSEHAANLFDLPKRGYIFYTRLNNPTNDILEATSAALEGGIAGAVVTASGTAAIATSLLVLLQNGDHMASSSLCIMELLTC